MNFINTCSSEYVEIYVGSGAKRVRDVFREARNNKPAVIFIDELEAMGMQRSSNYHNYSMNIERNATLNQLLVEMDGIENNEGVLIIAATNREDLLDPALIRPGRFDLKIHLNLPSKEERIEIFELNLNRYSLDEEISSEYLKSLGSRSKDITGAIIENIVNEAASMCFSRGDNLIKKDDIEESFKKNIEEMKRFKFYEERNMACS